MLGHYWYHAALRKVIIAFGTMFNDIEVHRTTEIAGGEEIKRFVVPLSYSSKEKWLRRLRTDSQLEGEEVRQQLSLPRLGFEMTSVTYDPQRKINTVTKRVGVDPDDPNAVLWQYARVPYDIELALYVIVDKEDDGLQIIEQILPFFTPEFTVTIKAIEGLEDSVDVPYILNSSVIEDNFEGTLIESRRVVIWTLTFTAKTYFYGPVNSSGIIREATMNIRNLEGGALFKRDTLTPDPLDAEPGDPFEVNVEIEECE